MGYISFDKEGSELLFTHLSLRAGRKSTIITTNLSFERWDEIFLDSVMMAAMIDRLTHKSYMLNMNGNSCRLKEIKKWLAKQDWLLVRKGGKYGLYLLIFLEKVVYFSVVIWCTFHLLFAICFLFLNRQNRYLGCFLSQTPQDFSIVFRYKYKFFQVI